jgi:hypothetical protein
MSHRVEQLVSARRVRSAGVDGRCDPLAPIEQWFVERGLPHFVERRDTVRGVWTRALPMLVIAYLVLGLNALDVRGWSWPRNVAAAVFVVFLLIVTWVVTNVMRRRPALERPREVGVAEVAVLFVGPALPTALFGQWSDVLEEFVIAALLLAAVYVITSYGVVSIAGWASRRAVAQIALLGNLVVRALPLLLLFTTFLFINAEVWQVAGSLHGVAFAAVLAVFFLFGAVFVLSRIPAALRGLAEFTSWGEIGELVAGTPAAELELPHGDGVDTPDLSTRQRLNIGLVSIFSQAMQITLVAAALAAFFVAFGFLAIPEPTAAAWTALDDVNVLLTITLDGRRLVITEPLLRVAGFLGAFSGMYFTVVLTTDDSYRHEFAEDVGPDIRQALAARLAYRHARKIAEDSRR